LQGTAPTEPQTAPAANVQAASSEAKSVPTVIVSPLDEMNKQVPAADPEKTGKAAKKPAKVARNK
jgi:hypothetical protein